MGFFATMFRPRTFAVCMAEVFYQRYGIYWYATIVSDTEWVYTERGLTKGRAARKAFKLYTATENR